MTTQGNMFGDDSHDPPPDGHLVEDDDLMALRPHSSLVVHFGTIEDRNEFAEMTGQLVTSKTIFIWIPALTSDNYNARIPVPKGTMTALKEDNQHSIFGADEDDGIDWEGMPEFENTDMGPYSSLVVHLVSLEDRNEFAKMVGQSVTPQTRFLWIPALVIENYNSRIRYSNTWTEDILVDESESIESLSSESESIDSLPYKHKATGEKDMAGNDDYLDPDIHLWPASEGDEEDDTEETEMIDNDDHPDPDIGIRSVGDDGSTSFGAGGAR